MFEIIELLAEDFMKLELQYRNSRSQMFFKVGVLKNFVSFTGKHLCWSLFLIKLQAWRPNFLKKETPTQIFPVKFL